MGGAGNRQALRAAGSGARRRREGGAEWGRGSLRASVHCQASRCCLDGHGWAQGSSPAAQQGPAGGASPEPPAALPPPPAIAAWRPAARIGQSGSLRLTVPITQHPRRGLEAVHRGGHWSTSCAHAQSGSGASRVMCGECWPVHRALSAPLPFWSRGSGSGAAQQLMQVPSPSLQRKATSIWLVSHPAQPADRCRQPPPDNPARAALFHCALHCQSRHHNIVDMLRQTAAALAAAQLPRLAEGALPAALTAALRSWGAAYRPISTSATPQAPRYQVGPAAARRRSRRRRQLLLQG